MAEDGLRKAKKQYQCYLCYDPIEQGEVHMTQQMTPWNHEDGDSFWTFRAHSACYTFWRAGYDTETDYDLSEPYEFKQAMAEASQAAPIPSPDKGG